MRKHTALSLLTGLCLLASCSPKFTEFTFVQMTDPQIGFRDNTPGFEKSDSLFSRAVEAVNMLNPKCVIITGDLINDAYDKRQDSIYSANRSKIKAQVHEIPGNHDIRPWNPENHAHYLELRGYDRFSFRLGGCAFIGFDSNCIKDGEEKIVAAKIAAQKKIIIENQSVTDSSDAGMGKFMTLAEEAIYAKAMENEMLQMYWLENELKKARRCKYIFVFLHCPVIRESIDEENDYFNFHKAPEDKSAVPEDGFTTAGARERYIALFKKYGVDVVFAGHTHMDYDITFDGIRFVTAGPVGMPLGRGCSGYEVIKVSKDGVDCKYIPTPGVSQKLP